MLQVDPAKLKALLIAHATVADLAVIGVQDEEAGGLLKAFIFNISGVGSMMLQAFIEKHVTTYKNIQLAEFVDEVPKSASVKIMPRLLRDGYRILPRCIRRFHQKDVYVPRGLREGTR